MNKRVLLDPGHGWSERKKRYGRPLMRLEKNKVLNLGMSHAKNRPLAENEYREDFGTLAIAAATRKELELAGVEVFMTRSTKNPLDAAGHLSRELEGTVWQRRFWKPWRWVVEARKRFDCDTVVAIHTNAGGGSGVIAFYRQREQSQMLAGNLVRGITNKSTLSLRGTRKRRFALLKKAPQGCLVECGFHDNAHDLSVLLDPLEISKIGQGIAEGILHSIL